MYRCTRFLVGFLATLLLAACGGGGGGGGSAPPPPAPQYTLGGNLSGLTGTLVLRNNGGNNLTLTANGGFVFSATLPAGVDYAVTVANQPANQTCVVNNDTGTIIGTNVTNLIVTCTIDSGPGITTYSVGGSVSGLIGNVKLRNNNSDEITVSASGDFVFPIAVNHGGSYAVTVSAQPGGQTCAVTSGSGSNSNTAVTAITAVAVNCTSSTYTLGGTLSGLLGSITLLSSSGESKTLLSDGSFTFDTPPIAYNSIWALTVSAQPAGQTCIVSNGSGTITGHVTDIAVSCTTNSYPVGGSINGLIGSLTLRNNGSDNLVRSDNGEFVFATALLYGSSYNVTVSTQPAGQTCTPTSASGILSGVVTGVVVSCVNNSYTLGGSVSGLTGSLGLRTDAGDFLTVAGNGAFTFGSAVENNSLYRVSVNSHPAGQFCIVNNGTGTISAANVSSISVICSNAAYRIGGTIAGLAGTLVLQNNGIDTSAIDINGLFFMPTRVVDGADYAVTILTQPAGQTCLVSNATGTATGDVSSIGIVCTGTDYSVGGTLSGLVGGTVTLQNNGAGDISLSGDGSFTFSNPVTHAQPYEVTVLIQPAGQICVVDNSTGTIDAANVENIAVICVAEGNAPAQPVLTLGTITNPRELAFTWPAAPGSTYYRLEKSVDGVAPYTQVGDDLTVTHATDIVSVHRHDWTNARYRLQACNADVCVNSNPISTAPRMLQAIGYFKASVIDGGDSFGTSLALSADGNTLAVGAFCESSDLDSPANNNLICAGAVYVFERDADNTWTQVAFYKAPNADADDLFGARLALSADGNTLAIGAPWESSAATGINGNAADNSAALAGAVYIYPRTAGTWQPLQAYIKASNTDAQDLFGNWVALSADGNTLAVGAPGEAGAGANPADNSAAYAGAAYVYTRSGTLWTEQARLKAASPDATDLFAISIALSADGNTLAAGGLGEDSAATGINGDSGDDSSPTSGAVWVFVRSGGNWSQQAYVKAANSEAWDRFGGALALSASGDTLAVGAHTESGGSTGVNGDALDNSTELAGAVYLFTRTGSDWNQQAYIKASDPDTNDWFGSAIALAGDGNTLAVGALREDSSAAGVDGDAASDAADDAGAVYLFELNGATWSQRAYLKASNAATGDMFGSVLALDADGDTLAAGAPGEDSTSPGVNSAGGGSQSNNDAESAGAVYLY